LSMYEYIQAPRKCKTLEGQSIVEFALILPVLLLITLGLLDLGRSFYFQETITNAAREGARYYSLHPDQSGQAISIAVREAGALGPYITVTPSGPTVDPNTGDRYVSVTVQYNFKLITPLVQQLVGQNINLRATSRMPAAQITLNP